jgi:hypothetical protein
VPYTSVKLVDFISQISELMDDISQRYWTYQEIQWTVYEALYMWGAFTAYWRERGSFTAAPTPPAFSGPSNPPTYYDMSVVLPQLRARTFTLDRMVREIQYMLLESPSGISGSGMSGQVDMDSITYSIRNARNRFVRDVLFPVSHHYPGAPTPVTADGIVDYPQGTMFIHRATWQDSGGSFVPMWRESAYAMDKSKYLWTLESGLPRMYSDSDTTPLQLQLMPVPTDQGQLETLTIDSVNLDVADPTSLLQVPDEWAHAVKYGALSQILSSAGQITDPLRAQYCESRYTQVIEFAKAATSINRALLSGVPLPLQDLSALDVAFPTWMNDWGKPFIGGTLFDILALCPGQLDQTYGVTVDLVRSAPIPDSNDYIQVGEEELDNLKDYIGHILTFKCGGRDFTSSIGGYDAFMGAVDERKAVNSAHVAYLKATFDQWQYEKAQRPDRGVK